MNLKPKWLPECNDCGGYDVEVIATNGRIPIAICHSRWHATTRCHTLVRGMRPLPPNENLSIERMHNLSQNLQHTHNMSTTFQSVLGRGAATSMRICARKTLERRCIGPTCIHRIPSTAGVGHALPIRMVSILAQHPRAAAAHRPTQTPPHTPRPTPARATIRPHPPGCGPNEGRRPAVSRIAASDQEGRCVSCPFAFPLMCGCVPENTTGGQHRSASRLMLRLHKETSAEASCGLRRERPGATPSATAGRTTNQSNLTAV